MEAAYTSKMLVTLPKPFSAKIQRGNVVNALKSLEKLN
jgi:hypothetical protein